MSKMMVVIPEKDDDWRAHLKGLHKCTETNRCFSNEFAPHHQEHHKDEDGHTNKEFPPHSHPDIFIVTVFNAVNENER